MFLFDAGGEFAVADAMEEGKVSRERKEGGEGKKRTNSSMKLEGQRVGSQAS